MYISFLNCDRGMTNPSTGVRLVKPRFIVG